MNIKNSIVIIDEAHNLVETITNIHSVSVSGAMLGAAHAQLSQYRARYAARLKARNLLYIKQLLFILASFIKLLGGAPGRDPGEVTSPGCSTDIWEEGGNPYCGSDTTTTVSGWWEGTMS